jgi:NDP-sugar pyrophosphorylase family protein
LAYPSDKYYWRDLGTPESLAQAAEDLKRNVIAP